MFKADLHVHTCYSKDSTSSLDEIVDHCAKVGIDCLAITDHDRLAGALEMKRIAPFVVIPGEEVFTKQGEIIGLFLEEEVPPGLSPEETVERIKAQGGLVYIPHPFDRFRPHSRIRRDALDRIASHIDLIEVANSRTFMRRDSARALELARSLGVPGIAGSDAHVVREIGRTYMEIPEFKDAGQFIQSLREGRIVSSKTSALVHFYNIRNRLLKRLTAKGHHV